MNKRQKNLLKALKRYSINLQDDPAGYNDEIYPLLDGFSNVTVPRWLTVLYSEQYEISFAKPSASKSAAQQEAADSIGDGYGKYPLAIVDLDTGAAYESFALVASGPRVLL